MSSGGEVLPPPQPPSIGTPPPSSPDHQHSSTQTASSSCQGRSPGEEEKEEDSDGWKSRLMSLLRQHIGEALSSVPLEEDEVELSTGRTPIRRDKAAMVLSWAGGKEALADRYPQAVLRAGKDGGLDDGVLFYLAVRFKKKEDEEEGRDGGDGGGGLPEKISRNDENNNAATSEQQSGPAVAEGDGAKTDQDLVLEEVLPGDSEKKDGDVATSQEDPAWARRAVFQRGASAEGAGRLFVDDSYADREATPKHLLEGEGGLFQEEKKLDSSKKKTVRWSESLEEPPASEGDRPKSSSSSHRARTRRLGRRQPMRPNLLRRFHSEDMTDTTHSSSSSSSSSAAWSESDYLGPVGVLSPFYPPEGEPLRRSAVRRLRAAHVAPAPESAPAWMPPPPTEDRWAVGRNATFSMPAAQWEAASASPSGAPAASAASAARLRSFNSYCSPRYDVTQLGEGDKRYYFYRMLPRADRVPPPPPPHDRRGEGEE